MKKFFLICAVVTFTLIGSNVYSLGKVDQKLEMRQNYSHLLTFNEKIVRYRVGDKEAFEVEILPDIFNKRHEMLVKPLKKTNTNLLVWTETCIYNFDIEAKSKGADWIFSFNNKEKELILGKYELDMPPELSQKRKIRDIEIDLPPKLK